MKRFLVFPSFSYSMEVESRNTQSCLTAVKEKFEKAGNKVLKETPDELEIKVSSWPMVQGIHGLPNNMILRIYRASKNSIYVEVVRVSEKTFSLCLLFTATIACILTALITGHFMGFIYPFFFYVAFWLSSHIPFHPAHRELKRLLHTSN